MKKLICCILLFSIVLARQNNYDLSVGTVRYYDECTSFYKCCVAAYQFIATEEVIADTIIDSQTYAKVLWKSREIYWEDETYKTETSFLKYEDGYLYKYTPDGDSLIQNFNFSAGDSIHHFFQGSNLMQNPPAKIFYDTLVTFPDETTHRILWGDDTTRIANQYYSNEIPSVGKFLDSVLVATNENWFLPTGNTEKYFTNIPFYFIDSIGVIYSEWNYRGISLVGMKTSDGRQYGREFEIEDDNNYSKSDSLSILEYYPLQIGNKWMYKDTSSFDWVPNKYIITEITGKAKLENQIEYFVFDDSYYRRIDTANLTINTFLNGKDTALYDLSVLFQDDKWGEIYDNDTIPVQIYNLDTISLFGNEVLSISFIDYQWVIDKHITLSQGFGLSYTFIQELMTLESTLVAAKINGVQYGSFDVSIDNIPIQKDFSLSQNYPNPFNPITKISYQLPINSKVNLSVYNILGEKIATLVNEKKSMGYHQVIWDATNYSSGVYFFKIETGEFVDYRKCLLVK